jgi:hypothetical protein
MHIFKTLFLILALTLTCNGGTIDPNVPDSEYVKYGEKHQCVTSISGVQKKDNKRFYASCVVIKPRIILTAAHILSESKEDESFITLNKENIKILASVFPKDFNLDSFAVKDIAVGYLEKDAKLDFYPELYHKDDEVGKVCSIAGNGITGNYLAGATFHDDKKRAGSNTIDEIFKELLICSVKDGPKTRLEFLIANGDSGGGLFIDKKLAGINSCVMADDGSPNSNFKDWSGHTRVSIHKIWIDEVIKLFEDLPKKIEP